MIREIMSDTPTTC